MDGLVFPVVILDESSQLLEPLGLLSFARFRCEKLIVVGDPMQLPPTLTSPYAGVKAEGITGEDGLGKTLYSRMLQLGVVPLALHIQYRLHPVLSAPVNALFYEGKLSDGITAEQRRPLHPDVPTLGFLNTGSAGHEETDRDGSTFNLFEVQTVLAVIDFLLDAGIRGHQIGVIVFYKAQMVKIIEKIRQGLPMRKPREPKAKASDDAKRNAEGSNQMSMTRKRRRDNEKMKSNRNRKKRPRSKSVLDIEAEVEDDDEDDDNEDEDEDEDEMDIDGEEEEKGEEGDEAEEMDVVNEEEEEDPVERKIEDKLTIQVSTVDAFQGGEKDVIILTASRTDYLGFIDEPHRLNVALTRARHHLLIVGKAQTLRTSPLWQRVIEHARLHRGFMSAPQLVAHKSFAAAKGELQPPSPSLPPSSPASIPSLLNPSPSLLIPNGPETDH